MVHPILFLVTREALSVLDDDQHHVISRLYYDRATEDSLAAELTRLRGHPYDRDRVHTIRRTALGRMRRHLERMGVAA